MTAPAGFRCDGCRRRISRRGRHFVSPGAALILCSTCVDEPAVHTRLFPSCRGQHDTCTDHVYPTTTAAGVSYLKSTP